MNKEGCLISPLLFNSLTSVLAETKENEKIK